MAYNNKFVVSVLINGKPIRELNVENKRTATVPFGSEYKIRLKNNNKKARALASVTIDGTDVLCGKSIILGPKEWVDLERFVDSKDSGSKFKFISLEQGEQTGEIQDPSSLDNGKIVVEFQKEKVEEEKLEPIYTISGDIPDWSGGGILRGVRGAAGPRGSRGKLLGASLSRPGSYDSGLISTDCVVNSATSFASCATDTAMFNSTDHTTFTSNAAEITKEEKGATVEGSTSNQKFEEGESFPVERNKTVLEIFLKGPSLKKDVEGEWALFVEGENLPRAQHVSKSALMAAMATMVLPEDKEFKITKVFRKY